jgi:hypothetical protein
MIKANRQKILNNWRFSKNQDVSNVVNQSYDVREAERLLSGSVVSMFPGTLLK